ncbi:hypothetical protein OPQ81_006587 [Rhizoctonia solani]|nr:hypothetical protein OPQ81_006587 [Rhizoctonia solani]
MVDDNQDSASPVTDITDSIQPNDQLFTKLEGFEHRLHTRLCGRRLSRIAGDLIRPRSQADPCVFGGTHSTPGVESGLRKPGSLIKQSLVHVD